MGSRAQTSLRCGPLSVQEPDPSTSARTRTWADVTVRPQPLVRESGAVRDGQRHEGTHTEEDRNARRHNIEKVSNNVDNDGYFHFNLSESSVIFIVAQKHFMMDEFCFFFFCEALSLVDAPRTKFKGNTRSTNHES